MTGVEAYPLQWPEGWPRSRRRAAPFSTGFAAARDGLLNELRLLGGQHVVISSNVELRRDGLPYANRAQPEDRGVAVYFVRDGKQQCIPCDQWSRVEDNLQAIRKTVEALRGLERWGAKSMVDAAFTGFQALPPAQSDEAPMTVETAARFLAMHGGHFASAGSDEYDLIESPTLRGAVYKRAAKKLHPDAGGSKEDFQRLQEAKQLLDRERAKARDR